MNSLSRIQELAKKMASDGQTLFRDVLGKLDFVASSEAYVVEKGLDRIETHYILVPIPTAEAKFALYTLRSVPKGVERISELPEQRIFHFAKPDDRQALEDLLRKDVAKNEANYQEGDLEKRLNFLADEIDEKTHGLTEGLIFIGGAVLFFNPLVGGIVLLSSILPAFGGSTIHQGLRAAGDKLKGWREKRTEKTAEITAKSTVARLKPEVFVNPLLGLAADTFHPDQSGLEPLMDPRAFPESLDLIHPYRIAAKAISEIYWPERAGLDKAKRRWIESLREIADEEGEAKLARES